MIRMLRTCMLLMLPMFAACQREAPPPPAPHAAAPSLTVDGSALVLKLDDGSVLRGTELAGAVIHLALDDGQVVAMKLVSIMPDPEDPTILRHDFQVEDGAGGWKPACEPNAYGERWGFPVALPEGHPGREGAITLTCASGAVGKCARFGYKPWSKGPNGEDLLPLHAACVHMVRADYCGDGSPHTKNGTEIDIYDDLRIQTSEPAKTADFAFEAGWTPKGAACVAHTRWSDVVTMDKLMLECPRLGKLPACTEESARAAGARLFNRSRNQ
jgi:hypothetical protein